MRRGVGWFAAFGLLAAAIVGCQERLTSPGECPELCPGGQAQVFDTVLSPLPNGDTSFTGYIARNLAGALLVSNGLPASEDRAVYRFTARPDSIEVRDTNRAFTVDSVLFAINVIARDTLVNGLKLYLHRIDPSVDLDDTFESIDQQLTDATIVDSIAVPDTLNAGGVQVVLTGAELDKVALPVGSGGVLALGIRIAAAEPTGVRLGASAAGTGATFRSYVTLDVPDTATAIRRPPVNNLPLFNSTFTQTPLVPDPAFLTVGGEPSSRSLLRFDLPQHLEDSATIVRATLELLPRSPLLGLRTDPAALQAKALFADLGAKSPVTTDTRFISADTLPLNSADTVRLDVTSIVRLWQSSERPEAIFLSLAPEAGSFTRAVFGSTRSGTVGPPRLRITYLKSFPFENP